MAVYQTVQQGHEVYGDSVIYAFKILVDGVAVKSETPNNPPLDWDNLPEGWAGDYPDKIFKAQVQNGCNAQQAIENFVRNFKAQNENPPEVPAIQEIEITE